MAELEILYGKIKELASQFKCEHSDYMQNVTRDEQFLRCICLGPWKQARRIAVTEMALSHFKERESDLRNFGDYRGLPFQWQNQMLRHLSNYLHKPVPGGSPHGRTFDNLCKQIESTAKDLDQPLNAARLLFNAVQGDGDKGSKVLWLFLRDYIRIPAFPIDRHIRRFLIQHSLPTCSWSMFRLCNAAAIDASLFNRGIIASINGEPGA